MVVGQVEELGDRALEIAYAQSATRPGEGDSDGLPVVVGHDGQVSVVVGVREGSMASIRRWSARIS